MENPIKKQRKKSGMLQWFVAKTLGISTKTMQRIESGKKKLSEDELKQLAKIFKCNVEEIRQN